MALEGPTLLGMGGFVSLFLLLKDQYTSAQSFSPMNIWGQVSLAQGSDASLAMLLPQACAAGPHCSLRGEILPLHLRITPAG